MKRIHIVGKSNSGKTTFLEALLPVLLEMELRVGTIKHSGHAHELDKPGKDSHRHRLAGGAPAAILSGPLMGVYIPRTDASAYDVLAPLYHDCDLVLVEGDIDATAPKVEIWRAAVTEAPLANGRDDIVAIISDDSPRTHVPLWSRSDLHDTARRILLTVGVKKIKT